MSDKNNEREMNWGRECDIAHLPPFRHNFHCKVFCLFQAFPNKRVVNSHLIAG